MNRPEAKKNWCMQFRRRLWLQRCWKRTRSTLKYDLKISCAVETRPKITRRVTNKSENVSYRKYNNQIVRYIKILIKEPQISEWITKNKMKGETDIYINWK